MSASPLQRLDFELSDFTRVGWVSNAARVSWSERISRVAAAWKKLEIIAVAEGLRHCALVFTTASDLVARSTEWLSMGLAGHPLTISGVPEAGYAARAPRWVPGEQPYYRMAVGPLAKVRAFRNAYDHSDHVSIGQLLGYPPCCRAFFEQTWGEFGLKDPTWPMALETIGVTRADTLVAVDPTPMSNVLWRWLGVRAVPHLPCCFACAETERLGTAIMLLGKKVGFEKEMEWLDAILHWPVEWSALHGIAEIKTPILRISTSTDATAIKYVVRLKSTHYPPEGANGISFPYNGLHGEVHNEPSAAQSDTIR